jgi:hypothetical protein
MLELSRLIVKLHLLVGSLPGVHISFMPEPVPFDQKLCDEPLKVLCAQPGSEVQERGEDSRYYRNCSYKKWVIISCM